MNELDPVVQTVLKKLMAEEQLFKGYKDASDYLEKSIAASSDPRAIANILPVLSKEEGDKCLVKLQSIDLKKVDAEVSIEVLRLLRAVGRGVTQWKNMCKEAYPSATVF